MLIEKCKHFIEAVSHQSQVFFSQQMTNHPTLKRPQQPQMQHPAAHAHAMVFGVMSMMLLLFPLNCVNAVGYSYTRFIGPVAGPERKIFVNDDISGNAGHTLMRDSGAMRFDYVGKPEYEFAYGVEDADAQILHNRNEMRDGDAVKGIYSLIDPDGTLRVVKYKADEINGFQAEVIRNAVPSLHSQLQQDFIHAPPSNVVHNNHHTPIRSQAHFKGSRIVDYPPFNTYKPNVVHPTPNQYETPPHLPIIYHDEDVDEDEDEDGDGDGDGDHNGRSNPHYEVREKPEDENQESPDQWPQYKVHEKPNEKYDPGYKSHNHVKSTSHKKKTQYMDENDEDDDDDDVEYDDMNDSEEVDDYDDTVHATHNGEDSYEYY